MNQPQPPSWREFCVIFAGYLAATLVVFSPVLPQFTTHEFITGTDDGLDFRWKVWWVRHAVVDLRQSPFHTDLLWYAQGCKLWLDALTPINGLQCIALVPAFGETPAFNLLVLESFALGGLFFCLFVRTFVDSTAAAFIAGLLFTLAPYHFSHLHGHLNFATCQFVPLAAWTAQRGLQTGGVLWGFACGVALLLCALSDLLYLIFGLLLVCGAIANSLRPAGYGFGGWFFPSLALTSLALVGPLVACATAHLLSVPHRPGHNPDEYSADLLLYFGPGATSVWREWSRANWSRFVGNAAENAGGLGVVSMAGCAFALWRRRPFAVGWLTGALAFALLSFGPQLLIRGQRVGIPMPYAVLERIVPGVRITGTPVRFCFLAMFCANVAAGIGIDAWLANRSTNYRRWLCLLVAAVVLVEFWPNEIPRSRISLSSAENTALDQLRHEAGSFAVLTAPTHDNLWHKYLQIHHRRPIVGGFISRVPEMLHIDIRDGELVPVLYGWSDPISGTNYNDYTNELARFGDVRYILAVDEKRRQFVQSLGWKATFVGERFSIYRVPKA